MCKIITPVVTIFSENGAIDIEGNKKVIDFLIEGGVDGILALGSTGEFTNMTIEQRKELFRLYSDYNNGRVELYAGTGCLDAADTIELTNYADGLGYKGVMIIGPYYYGLDQDKIFKYYDKVAKSVKSNIYLYNYPDRSGHTFEPDTVKRIVDANANVVGMKDSISTPGHFNDIIMKVNNENFEMYAGFDDQFLYNLTAGGKGGIGALSNIVPEIWSSLVKAYRNKEFDQTFKLANIIHGMMPIYGLDSNSSLIIKKLMNYRGLDLNETSIFPFEEISEENMEYGKKLVDQALSQYKQICQ